MIDYPDINQWGPPRQEHLDWLKRNGVSVDAMIHPEPMRLAIGVKAKDGRFENESGGASWIVFPEQRDVVFWQPRTGDLATWSARAFALGEAVVSLPETYSFDCRLNLFADPLDWLRAGRDGAVVLDWVRAFERLQDCPRIAIDEGLLPQYKRHMKPARTPEVFVMPTSRRAAA